MSSELSTTMNSPAVLQLPLGARWLLRPLRLLQCGRLTLEFDDGHRVQVAGKQPGEHAVWRLHRPMRLMWRILRGGLIGLAEGYHAGDWSSPDLSSLLLLGAHNADAFEAHMQSSPLGRLVHRLRHRARPNTRRGSRRNIAAHYDLGNDFYRLWLDAGMTYSSALGLQAGVSLQAAQEAKYARLFDQLEARAGQNILEIGCGWGGFAEYAARQGAAVTGLTLSQEQLAFAQARMAEQGLDARVDLHLRDYREHDGRFDHIVSIEMFEAVGEAYWADYFRVVHDRLKPGGRAAIQVIVIDEAHYEGYLREPDYIQLYIFPGGMLPTERVFIEHAARAGLKLRDRLLFGEDYAATLAHWRARFEAEKDAVLAQGFDERFCRMWSYYLAYCEAGFRSRRIDVMQIVLEREEGGSCASCSV